MRDVYWLEQTEADVPAGNDWLSASEAGRLNSMRIAKRRADWRLGRWTAKHALAMYRNLPGHLQALANIEIRAAPSGAPEAFFSNQSAPATISLSHRAGLAVCAVAPPDVALGCDLELIEPHSDAFVADYFTADEQAVVAQAAAGDRPRLLALLWSAKESALKALREGLRLQTGCVVVSLLNAFLQREEERVDECAEDSAFAGRPSVGLNRWCPLQVRYTRGQVFDGWWQHTGNYVRTLAATPRPGPPILLNTTALRH